MDFTIKETPLDIIIERERNLIIREKLKEINSKHALILRLHYWGNLSYKQIADIINSTENSMNVTSFNARNKLKELLVNSGIR